MRPLSCLNDTSGLLIADASVAINLNATGCPADILHALPYRVALVNIVRSELELGRERGRRDAELTQALIESKHLELVGLGETGLEHFEELVVGSAADTLDDGEAATLAYALEVGATAVIDERKALRICASRYSGLLTASSLDLFGHPEVLKALGEARLAEAVFGALREARMRVTDPHLVWVVELIGRERAFQCPSLPRKARER
jgi:predicted nucleic acid-binding protein